MTSDLYEARTLAKNVRFREDQDNGESKNESPYSRNELESFFSQSDLSINKDLTPDLYKVLNKIYDHLKIPKNSIKAFVYASQKIQAECYSVDKEGAVIRFSSHLIELLDDEEFEFVAGHEIGHFLLGHICESATDTITDLDHLINSRSREISADRMGLISCESLDAAVRAMIKTTSGLSSQRLRFDTTAFLDQLKKIDESQKQHSQMATHPSMVMRCQALFWFSLYQLNYNSDQISRNNEKLIDTDNKIIEDLKEYIDGPARELIEKAKQDYALWYATEKVIQDKVFDKNEQKIIRELFGNEILSKLINFLKGMDMSNIDEVILNKKKEAANHLINVMSKRAKSEIKLIEENIVMKFQ